MSSTSSQELAASASGSKEPECEPSRSARSSHSPDSSSPSIGPASQSMKMSPNCEAATLDQLMLFAEVSPVRTSVPRDMASALAASAAACGKSTPDLLANYDPVTSSWRTSQLCLVEGSMSFSGIWPRSGLMQSGTAYQLPPLARITDATESGLWHTPRAIYGEHPGMTSLTHLTGQAIMWPTPNAGDYKAGMSNAPGRQQSSLPRSVGIVEGVSSGRRGGLNPTWVEWLMGFPMGWTALKDSATPSSRKSRKSSDAQS